jgi:hypothetical protein
VEWNSDEVGLEGDVHRIVCGWALDRFEGEKRET